MFSKMICTLIILSSLSSFAGEDFKLEKKKGTMISKIFNIDIDRCIENLKMYRQPFARCQIQVDETPKYNFDDNFFNEMTVGNTWSLVGTEAGQLDLSLMLHPNGYMIQVESYSHSSKFSKELVISILNETKENNPQAISGKNSTIETFVEDAE